jgi:nucleoside-diphosphate-sugar epimerase
VRVVVTGATGFVGARLVPVLDARGHQVVTYSRGGTPVTTRVTAATGDITDLDALTRAMQGADVVLHLAATTGKASAAVHHRTIVDGTRAVLEACRRAGVSRVVAVSSIAAGFADLRDYPYARAKLAAEALVSAAPLRSSILRPTAIFGPGSPVQRGLTGLASLPVMPVIGSDAIRLQPIHVDDVASALADTVDDPPPDGATIDLGGPDAMAVEPLLRRLRATQGKASGLALRLPAWLVVGPLRAAEALGLGGVLPVSAGQFSSFVHSGEARPHPWTAARVGRFATLDAMLAAPSSPMDAAPVARAPRAVDRARLTRECHVFTSHILSATPAQAVVDAYVRAHERSHRFAARTAFDDRLVAVAMRHPLLTRLADQYATLAAPSSLLRRKLVLLLAILETTPPHYHTIDAPLAGGAASTVVALAVRGTLAALGAVAALVLIAPLHLLSRGGGRA